jgi:serine phosphatase RsbU (regulator of sigma subunit)
MLLIQVSDRAQLQHWIREALQPRSRLPVTLTFYVSGAKGAVTTICPSGPLFGVVKEAQYRERTFSYAAGETFVLVTDGLLEIPPPDGGRDFWNMARLCRVTSEVLASAGGISAAHIVSRARWSFGAGFKDDVAVLVATTKC